MKNWDRNKRRDIEAPINIKKFINEIATVCQKYNLSISHEDSHGAFIITKYDDFYIKWLKDFIIDLPEENEVK